jgi:hypothetical protein
MSAGDDEDVVYWLTNGPDPADLHAEHPALGYTEHNR